MSFLIRQTLIYAIPLMVVALAGIFAERSGIINLALEGIMIFGAFIGVLFVRMMQAMGWFEAAKAADNWVALQGYLLLAMLVCIVLGMGLPTAAAYIIASSTIATALIKLGVPVLGAHMFLFYFSSIACITPPVALASYAAAGICKAPPMKVSMEAVKIGIVAFLVPYTFIYNPSILTYDFSSPYMILDTIVTFVCCVVDALPISYVVQGYHYRPIRLYERALFLVIAIGLIWPGVVVPLISLAVFLLFWLPARAKYYKENPKLPTPAAN